MSYIRSDSDLTVGDTISIIVQNNSAAVASVTMDGGFLQNESVPQIVQINAQNLKGAVNVRVKAELFGGENIAFDFVTTDHFVKDVDGYYYLDTPLQEGNKATFCSYIVIPEGVQLVSSKKYILTFVVETLNVENDAELIWKNQV